MAQSKLAAVDKAAVKSQIKELKLKRQAVLEAKDPKELKKVRRKIRGLKRQIRGTASAS